MKFQTVKDLLGQLEKFEQETGLEDLESFSGWLVAQHNGAKPYLPTKWDNDYPPDEDGRLAMSVSILNQHAKHYIKTALKDTPLKGLFDFTFLAGLLETDQRKSDLINLGLLEFSPGMEVIRRLIRNGLIEDFEDPTDGRSRRVRITALGLTVFQHALTEFSKVKLIVAGNLKSEEKRTMIAYLSKLIHFHQPIWDQDLGTDLEVILDKYLGEVKS
jgi:DNA-binding MarR family transcriptional regulator